MSDNKEVNLLRALVKNYEESLEMVLGEESPLGSTAKNIVRSFFITTQEYGSEEAGPTRKEFGYLLDKSSVMGSDVKVLQAQVRKLFAMAKGTTREVALIDGTSGATVNTDVEYGVYFTSDLPWVSTANDKREYVLARSTPGGVKVRGLLLRDDEAPRWSEHEVLSPYFDVTQKCRQHGRVNILVRGGVLPYNTFDLVTS